MKVSPRTKASETTSKAVCKHFFCDSDSADVRNNRLGFAPLNKHAKHSTGWIWNKFSKTHVTYHQVSTIPTWRHPQGYHLVTGFPIEDSQLMVGRYDHGQAWISAILWHRSTTRVDPCMLRICTCDTHVANIQLTQCVPYKSVSMDLNRSYKQ